MHEKTEDQVLHFEINEELNDELNIVESPVFQQESFVPLVDDRAYKPAESVKLNASKTFHVYSVTKLKEALDKGDYSMVGRTFKGKRTRDKDENHHSVIMTQLVETIDRLEDFQKKAIDPQTIDADIETLQNIYDEIFKTAFSYTQKFGGFFAEGRARRDMVCLIRDMANEERLKIANNARAMAVEVAEGESYTFSDVITKNRTRHLEVGKYGVKNITSGGAGTSDLIVVEKEDGSKMYIRRSETLKPDSVSDSAFYQDEAEVNAKKIAELEKKRTAEGTSEADKAKLALDIEQLNIARDCCEKVAKNLDDINREMDGKVSGAIKTFLTKFTFVKPGGFNDLWKAIIDGQKKAEDKKLVEKGLKKLFEGVLDEKDLENDLKLFYIEKALKAPSKLVNQREFARVAAAIPDGANVSNRNVAVSVLARAFGLRDIIAESEMVEFELDGKKVRGVVMEEAKGGDIKKVQEEKKKEGINTEYTPEVIKQLTSLHIFDVICGQVDRKADNYVTTFEEKEVDGKKVNFVKSIKGIDNDMSCGVFDHKNGITSCVSYYDIPDETGKVQKFFLKGCRQNLPTLADDKGKSVICAVDSKLKDRILAMKPEFIDFLMMGILTKEERKSMKARLTEVQKILKKTSNGRIMKNDEDWGRFKKDLDSGKVNLLYSYLRPSFKKKV